MRVAKPYLMKWIRVYLATVRFSWGALFFAVLHLGVVVLATSTMSTIATIYLLGLMMVLVALILG